jgi:two-component system sensor histidine kinase YesM
MVTVLPSQPLIDQSHQIMMQFILIYLAFLVLALLVAHALSRSITGRIASVSRQMQKVREGVLVPMESPTAHDEVGDLIDTYNYMTYKMNLLMEKQAQAAEDLRIAEFNSLQAQINPHFLYNTMDMINWLAVQGRTDEISNAVQSLSRFYRLTLSNKTSIVTIASEEEHASIYVHLQNMRYHDSIQWISDIPDELMEYTIPKLTLQPIVENAILHGILEKETRAGTIVLTGWMEGEDLVLLLSDDGVGIPDDILRTILTGTGQSRTGGTNIAISNTHRRLQLLYGEAYGLTYTSRPGEGTEVQIRIPARR